MTFKLGMNKVSAKGLSSSSALFNLGKSPLKHEREAKHDHEGFDKDSNYYNSYEDKLIEGNPEYGSNDRLFNKNLNGQPSAHDNLMSMATSIANDFNSGEVGSGGTYTGSDFIKKKTGSFKINFNKGTHVGGSGPNVNITTGKKRKTITEGAFNDTMSTDVETRDANLATNLEKGYSMNADNIYKIMRENGGMGSIVDGVFVGGNPNANTQSVRSRGSISKDEASDKKIAVEKQRVENERSYYEDKHARKFEIAKRAKAISSSIAERKAALEQAKNNSN
tara:strand:- start:877 stop:1713 length:837 start_codon:yes stop_codon:yes gene_type:complete